MSVPIWAGLIALVNEGREDAGKDVYNNGNPQQILDALYSLPTTDFHPPAELGGDNGSPGDGLLNPGRYDEVTGLGSPIATLLVPGLVNFNEDAEVTPVVTVSTKVLNLGTTTQGIAGCPDVYGERQRPEKRHYTDGPTGVELSDNGGKTFSTTLDLLATGGTVVTTTIYACISASAAVGSIRGNIAIGSTEATEQDIAVTGTVKAAPAIVVSAAR